MHSYSYLKIKCICPNIIFRLRFTLAPGHPRGVQARALINGGPADKAITVCNITCHAMIDDWQETFMKRTKTETNSVKYVEYNLVVKVHFRHTQQ
jgi:hypothetical protein